MVDILCTLAVQIGTPANRYRGSVTLALMALALPNIDDVCLTQKSCLWPVREQRDLSRRLGGFALSRSSTSRWQVDQSATITLGW